MKKQCTIKSNIRDYTAYFETDASFIRRLASLSPSLFIVDENVLHLYGESLLADIPRERLISMPAREEVKNMEMVCQLYDRIMSYAPRKNLNLVSIGGGITQDVTGFVASTLYRGVKWYFVPTTLLAQIDSCIGAKTSLNFKRYKNLIGSFYPPMAIHVFPPFTETLSEVDFYSGVGEMAKLHLMGGKQDTENFLAALPRIAQRDHAVMEACSLRCIQIKKSYIEEDEFDTGRRNMLNYGHCFGHAIENATNFLIPHGQAVVLGMRMANKYAVKHGYMSAEYAQWVDSHIISPIYKAGTVAMDAALIVAAMEQDKKNLGNGLALVMMKDDHEMVKITDMRPEDARQTILSCI